MAVVFRKIGPMYTIVADTRDYLCRVIGTSISHNKNFDIGDRLPQRTCNGVWKDGAPIKGRNNDGNEWVRHHGMSDRITSQFAYQICKVSHLYLKEAGIHRDH